MEIADIFVVNKADREGANLFVKNLMQFLHTQQKDDWTAPVIKAIATKGDGVEEIIEQIEKHQKTAANNKRPFLLAEKAYQLIQKHRMKNIDKRELQNKINEAIDAGSFNLYAFVKEWTG